MTIPPKSDNNTTLFLSDGAIDLDVDALILNMISVYRANYHSTDHISKITPISFSVCLWSSWRSMCLPEVKSISDIQQIETLVWENVLSTPNSLTITIVHSVEDDIHTYAAFDDYLHPMGIESSETPQFGLGVLLSRILFFYSPITIMRVEEKKKTV